MKLKPNLIERTLAHVAPRAALRRFSARASLANLERSYDAAKKGRLTDGWISSGTSADAEVSRAAPLLRNRMRDLVRNNPLAESAVNVLKNYIVGAGIMPRANTGDPKLNKRINELFDAWSKQSDADGHGDYFALQSLAVSTMIEGGDCFARRRRRGSRFGMEVPVQIQLYEADHLDASKDQADENSTTRQGIVYDNSGRRIAYWMYPEHPGDTGISNSYLRRLESVRVPAEQMAHLFERRRIQQRGVPWGTSAMTKLRDLDDWHAAELLRKKTEACMVGVVLNEDGGSEGVSNTLTDAQGQVIEQFEPGMFVYSRGGRDVKFNTPTSHGGIQEWLRVQHQIVAAGFRIPYELLTGDLKQANYSSMRAGRLKFRRFVEHIQWAYVIPQFCEPTWRWFIEAAWTAGLIPSADVPVKWAPPRFDAVDPLKDAQADQLEVRNGFATLKEKIAERGYDPEDVLAEHQETAEQLDQLGLIFDSDPRRTAKSGGAQSSDAPDEEETDEDDEDDEEDDDETVADRLAGLERTLRRNPIR